MLKKIITLLITLLTLSAVGCISYCYYLTDFVENRFSGRRWQIPSTIYSDTTLLYAGKQMPGKSLQERLVRLGYRKTAKNSLEQGEYIPGEKRISVFLNDLSVAGKQRPGFPVLITFENSSIKNMVNAISGEEIHVLELEPEILMQYFGKDREKRQLVSIRDVPDHLKHAVMAAEDNRFHSHFGISPTGIIRAVYTNLRYGSIRQGGSTLTQQLAKNYFLTPERTYTRKIKELFIALAIEMVFEKDEIMEIYLNEIYFGRNGSISVNGVGEAAAHYFGKRVEQLTLPESAAIAGLIKGPNLYSPYNNMERCVKRRNIVLSAMHKKGWISAPVLEEAAKAPLKTSGFETYRRKAPYFLDYVESQLKTLYPETTLSSMGFSIQTTLDTQIQAAAEKALAMGLERLEKKRQETGRKKADKKLQGAVVVMQPRTGDILAMVGGRDYGESQFNRITQAKRQPGSCFKPIIASAFIDSVKPTDFLFNGKVAYDVGGKTWIPRNFGTGEPSRVTLKHMLSHSSNRAAVDMIMRGGVERGAAHARKFKFSTNLPAIPSIVLGSPEVIPLELARAYCSFAADGVQPYPRSLKTVMDENQKILTGKHMDISPVLTPSQAFLITSMLEATVTEGTARALRAYGIDFTVAGKTGTTNDYRDAWFIGYTPDILALVWVGLDGGKPMGNTGGSAALPIWADLIKASSGHVSGKGFKVPPGIVRRKICTESRALYTEGVCPSGTEAYYLAENAPMEPCELHMRKKNFFQKIFN